jgi:hypothetical protein
MIISDGSPESSLEVEGLLVAGFDSGDNGAPVIELLVFEGYFTPLSDLSCTINTIFFINKNPFSDL